MSTRPTRQSGRQFVYFIQTTDGGAIKIGVTRDVTARFAVIQRMSPVHLRVIGVIANAGFGLENDLHRRFAQWRCHGEWFEPARPLLQYIAEHAKPFDVSTGKDCKEYSLAEVLEATQFPARGLLQDLRANKFRHVRRGSEFFMSEAQVHTLIEALTVYARNPIKAA